MEKAVVLPAFLSVLLCGIAFSTNLDYPFCHSTMDGYDGCLYSIAARNFNNYGIGKLRFGLCYDPGPVREHPEITLNHPPMVPLLVAFNFSLFGEREISARAVPFVFSLLAVLLFFLFLKNLFEGSAWFALAGVLAAAGQVVWTYYATLVDPMGPGILFVTAGALWAAERWLDSGKRAHLAWANFFLVFGFLVSWVSFFLAGLLGMWAVFFAKERKLPERFSFWILALVSGLLLLGWRAAASQVGPSPGIVESAGRWSILGMISGNGPISFSQALARVISFHKNLFFLPVTLLGLLGGISLLAFKRSLAGSRSLLLILVPVGVGLLQIIFFLQGAYIHEYFQLSLAPGLGFLAAFFFFLLWKKIPRFGRAILFLAVLVGVASLFRGYIETRRRWAPLLPHISEVKTAGRKLASLTSPEETLVSPLPPLFVLGFYAERRILCGFKDPGVLLETWRAWGGKLPGIGGVILWKDGSPDFVKVLKKIKLKGPIEMGPFNFWDARF